MKKKIAGIERPYSPRSLGELLCDYLLQGGFDQSACLDYFSPSDDDVTEIKREDFNMFSITSFGSNEGIYTSFYIEYYGEKRIRLMVAKTLGTSKEYYVNMHLMAANICYSFNKFVDRNLDRFMWYGYDISYVVGGKEVNYCWIPNMDRVDFNAEIIRKKFPKARVYYVDCYTREKHKYGF